MATRNKNITSNKNAAKKAAVKKAVKKAVAKKPGLIERAKARVVREEAIADEVAARAAEDKAQVQRIDNLQRQSASHANLLSSQGVLLTETARSLGKLETKFIADPAVLTESFIEPLHLIHEHVDGSHRIVTVGKDGVSVGKWAARNEIAVLADLRATTSFWDGVLPTGIFDCRELKYSGLGG